MEIEGIKTDSKRLEEAKKHIKIEEYVQAKKLLDEILKNDHFNIEAQCEWIRTIILYFGLKKNCIDNTSTRQEESEKWNFIKEIIDRYDKLRKVDDNKEYEKFLKDYIETILYLEKEYNQILEDEKKCIILSNKINDFIKQTNTTDNSFNYAVNSLINFFNINDMNKYIRYSPSQGYETLIYRLEKVELFRNGSMQITYVKDRGEHFEDISYYPERVNKYAKTNKMLLSMNELENLVNKYIDLLSKDVSKIKKKAKFKENMSTVMAFGYFIGIALVIYFIGKYIFSGV